MLKILLAAIFVSGIAFTPVYVLDSQVMPQLSQLKDTYENLDQAAQDVSAGSDVESTASYKSAQTLNSSTR